MMIQLYRKVANIIHFLLRASSFKKEAQRTMSQATVLIVIESIIQQYNVPLLLISAIIEVESAWNPNALGDNGTSYGLFQLHIGGQADQAIKDGHKPSDLFDPALNAKYAMPSIAQAWNNLKATFQVNNFTWWLDFATQSGHPGGSRTDPATINEATLLQQVYKTLSTASTPAATSITLSATKEVGEFLNINQFESGESAYECVAYSVAICRYAGEVGKGATGSSEDIDQLADSWYAKFTGSDAASNMQGLSVQQEEQMIRGVGNHFQELPISANSQHDSDLANIKGALKRGYPVLICGAETGMYDIGLGDRVPYSWTPTGNHCIVATGIAPDGNLLVRDPANVDNSGPRPGPRTYDISKLQLISGVVFVPSWMPQPDPNTDWTKDPTQGVPQGWSDNGTVLKAPNGHLVVSNFRQHILTTPTWLSWDVPLQEQQTCTLIEESNPGLGGGIRQIFTGHMLEWTSKIGVQEAHVGQELMFVLNDRDRIKADDAKNQSDLLESQTELAQAQAQVTELQQQVDALKAQLAALQPPAMSQP
jgi:hypothetical protein